MAALSISFQGAARTVTGSRHLLRFGGHSCRFDGGLYQGHRDEAERINRRLRFDPARLRETVHAEVHVPAPGEEVALWN